MAEAFSDIQALLKRHRPELEARYKVQELGIFGSYARGQQRQGSDVDVLVEFRQEDMPTLLEFIAFQQFLEDMLQRKVDLVRKGAIRPELKERILEEVIYL